MAEPRLAKLDASLSTTAWYGGMPGLPLGRDCATLFMGNRGRPGWRNGDPCHSYSQIPHSHLPCPSLFLTHTLHSLPVPPLWIEEQQIELGRRRLMSSGFATQHLLWHIKLEQQAPLQYAHKLVSYNIEVKKETGLARSNSDFFWNNGNNLKIGWYILLSRDADVVQFDELYQKHQHDSYAQPLASCSSVNCCDLWY